MDLSSVTDEELVSEAAERWRQLCAAQGSFLEALREVDVREAWEIQGAMSVSHWLSLDFGLSYYRSDRWLGAAEALARLPRTAAALESGELSIFKVEELVRMATPEDEEALVRWARDVPSGAIKEEADRRLKATALEASSVEEERTLKFRTSDDRRAMEMYGRLPTAEGTLVKQALDRMADELPDLTGDPDPAFGRASRDQLRADALVALVMQTVDRETVLDHETVLDREKALVRQRTLQRETSSPAATSILVHAQLDALLDAEAGAGWTEGGAFVPPETMQRLLCGSDLKTVIEDATGMPLAEVRGPRAPSRTMLRQLRDRDRRCTFPNCSHSRFTNAHHLQWWSQGGKTQLDNLVLLCTFHHKLVHEHGWSLRRDAADGMVRWFRPDGTGYRAGPRAA